MQINPKIMETMPAIIKMVTSGQGANITLSALIRKLDRIDTLYQT